MNIERHPQDATQPSNVASTTNPRLCVIIVSYNTRKLTRRLLQSMRAFPPNCTYEVFVVDNHSQDNSVTMLRQEFPWVHVIANQHNLGYSAAVNQGLDASASEYVLILNPDIILEEGSVDELLAFMDENPNAGLSGAKLLNTDGSLQHSCRSFYTPKTLLMRRTILGKLFPKSPVIRQHLMLDYDHETARAVDWVIGACMMVRRKAIEAVGGMDERFFLYFEDVDWCYRMSHQGWKVYYVPQSRMIHEHRRDSARPRLNRSFWAHLGSLLRFYEKWNRYAYGLKRYREVLKLLIFVLGDLLAVNAAFLSAYGIRVVFAQHFDNPLYTLENYNNFWVFINIVTLLAFTFSGQYRLQRGKHAADELFDIGRALGVGLVVIMASTYIAHERLISRAVVVFFFLLALIFVWGLRRVWRILHAKVLEMRLDLRRLLIIGNEEETRELRSRLVSRPELGLDVVGSMDLGPVKSPRSLGVLADLGEVVREQRIQEVVVAPSAAATEAVGKVVMDLRRRAVDVKVVSGFAEILSRRAHVRRLADLPVLHFERDTLYSIQLGAKRIGDIAVASLLLVLGTPFCVLYWLLAKLRGRPLFDREIRLGFRACLFELPRVNDRLGLPPSDLVNLPAWIAVLRGKMSLVGPYALPPHAAESLQEWQQFRYDMRPGVAGFWRNMRNDDFDFESVVRLDLYYVQNWSLSMDFRLLLMSCGRMLLGRGTRRNSGNANPMEPA